MVGGPPAHHIEVVLDRRTTKGHGRRGEILDGPTLSARLADGGVRVGGRSDRVTRDRGCEDTVEAQGHVRHATNGRS